MRLEPARAVLVGLDDHRHPRDARRLGVADRQRLDVERAAPEERRHAIQDARLVVDVNSECMLHV
jgi:hypothetical protein